jgi:hypothetical protein
MSRSYHSKSIWFEDKPEFFIWKSAIFEAISIFIRKGKARLTDEAAVWFIETEISDKTIRRIISDFYSNRKTPEDKKVKLGRGWFELYCGQKNDIEEAKDSKPTVDLYKRLEENQKEMQAFAYFLKDKFMKEGESYVENIRDNFRTEFYEIKNGKRILRPEIVERLNIEKVY